MRLVRGEGVCNEYGALNDPLVILGVERSLFFLCLMFALVIFVALDALLLALVGFAVFWALARVTTAYDDRFVEVLRQTLRNPGGWYDAADYGSPPWFVVVDDSDAAAEAADRLDSGPVGKGEGD